MSGPGVDAAHTPDPARASGVKHAGSRLRVRDVLVGVAAWLGAMVLGAVGIRADASFIQYVAAASPLALAIAVRRLAPTAVGIAAGGIALLAVALSGTAGAIAGWLALPSLYTLTRWGRRTVALAVGPAMLALFALVEMMARLGFFRSGWTMAAVTTGFSALMVWGWGLVRRSRGERRADASRRAAAAAREREQLAELAAASERNRIAREMHDIVAHSLSVMIAQADGGLYASRSDPEAGRRALGTIAETGRAALGDMRRILGVLRHPAEARTGALRAPVPDSQDLEALAAQMRDAGLDVAMVRVGVGSTLPPGIALALYRICREALTNVLKHAGPGAHVTVIDRWEPHQLTLDIHDDGRGAAATHADGPGHGLIGMRERAEMLGGSLEAGPARGGGFTVTARIPLPTGNASIAPSPSSHDPEGGR